jgi:bifunctional non-homologous end joining protein LigD
MGLQRYRQKRDFKKTAEPAGAKSSDAQLDVTEPFFVVQKHDASRLHYDFRLAMDGVLKSWAVPKGFPWQKGDKRLAMRVEDHPIEYADFEGIIAPGNYGAGTVMVWDRGTYEVLGMDRSDALAQGKLHLVLSGKKLKGEWALVRLRHPHQEGKDEWLLLKAGVDVRPISTRADDRSALTQRTLKQIAKAADAKWPSDHAAAPKRSGQSRSVQAFRDPSLKQLPRAKPEFRAPMKALLVRELPTGPDWVYEVKFDGYRALALKEGARVRLISRNGNDLTSRYGAVAEALRKMGAKEAALDGEVVAVDSQGRSQFQLLQAYQTPGAQRPPLLYYAFDLLNLEGKDLTRLPLSERKSLLEGLLEGAPDTIRFSASFPAEPGPLVEEMQKRGLEGLIAKRVQSQYETGRRSGSWVKFKWGNEQEFVVGGYTPPKGARSHFGAILVGYVEKGRLRFASKVGTGFDTSQLAALHARFEKLVQQACPFVDLPERIPGGLRAAEMKTCTWLKPELVCQIRFTEWTQDGHLRHPVFLGLREDKQPSEVVREKPTT